MTDLTGPEPGADPEALRARVAGLLAASRARSTALTDAVDEADLVAQHSPLMSPLVWDLAHIGSQEELWLVRDVGGREPLRPEIDGLYDAFQHSRASRVELPLLTPAETRAYVAEVRDKALDALEPQPADRARRLVEHGFAFGMIVQHEQQHDETMLATHQLRAGAPVLHAPTRRRRAGRCRRARCSCPAGRSRWAPPPSRGRWTTSGPRTPSTCPAFVIDTAPVTNGEYAEFVDAGGYDDPRWWTDGRLARTAPRPGSSRRGSGSATRTARGAGGASAWSSRCRADEPVVHVCCARGRRVRARGPASGCPPRRSGRRPPATTRPPAARGATRGATRTPPRSTPTSGQRHLRPGAGRRLPARARRRWACEQLIGDVWEWTASGWHPYPGFEVFPYPEYSEVFFGGDYRVLRGGSFGTDPAAVRATFRNWDHPIRRQIFAGFRCARDATRPRPVPGP